MMKIAGSASGSGSESGSISQRHGSANPDPHQNVMDPQHWVTTCSQFYLFKFSPNAQGTVYGFLMHPPHLYEYKIMVLVTSGLLLSANYCRTTVWIPLNFFGICHSYLSQ
jgi:hypothetical protein